MSNSMQYLPEAIIQDRQHLVDLFAGHAQGWAERQPVRIESAEESVRQRPPADFDAEVVGEAFLRRAVFHELDALQQPFAADVADDGVFIRQRFEACAQAFTLL